MEKGKESGMKKAVWNIEESQKMVKEKEGVAKTKQNKTPTERSVRRRWKIFGIGVNWVADLGETSFRGMMRAAVSSDRFRAELEVRRGFPCKCDCRVSYD